MAITDSKGTLSRAAKELLARWEDLRMIWSDAQSQEFEKTYLLPIEQDVRGALSAMDQVDQAIQAIESDCE